MNIQVIWAYFIFGFLSVCFACQTNDDCSYYDVPIGNKTTRIYLECCQMFGNPRKCVEFGSQCYQIPTWRPFPQSSWPEIPTWPTQPDIPDFTVPDINWTPRIFPTKSYDSSGTVAGIVKIISMLTVVLFALFIIGVWFVCKRRRRNQGQLLTVATASQRPIHEVPVAPSQIEAPYSHHNEAAVDHEIGTIPHFISPPSYEDVCSDVTQSYEDSIPDVPPPRYEDIV